MVLNTAAYNLVDKAEGEGREAAYALNRDAVGHLAEACAEAGSALVHFSTDYVFSGKERSPRRESDPAEPVSAYGRSKLEGEKKALAWEKSLVFRVCGLYGTAGRRESRPNFVERMLQLAGEGRPLKVVQDQVLTPSYTLDTARKVWDVLGVGPFGVYHLTNAGECSWHDFAYEIFRLSGIAAKLEPTTLEAFNAPAPRPPYSVLDNRAIRHLGLDPMPHWKDALKRYLAERVAGAAASQEI